MFDTGHGQAAGDGALLIGQVFWEVKMSDAQDKLNWIKNLIQMMCCDRRIDKAEKEFLFRAAKELDVRIDDWNTLLKRVLKDERVRYPISDRAKAIAALKSLVVMAKADKKVDESEKRYILQFAKFIGVSNSELKEIVRDIDVETLFRPVRQTSGSITALREDFDKIDEFVEVARENGKEVEVVTFKQFVSPATSSDNVVCFHAAEEKDLTIDRCRRLLDNTCAGVVGVLTRFQGFQVRYLLEIGMTKCVIEPVYSRDVDEILSLPRQ